MIKQSQDVLQNIFQKAFKLEFGEICDNCELLRLWITKFAGIKPVFPVFTVLKGGNFPPHLKNPRPMGRGFVRWGGKNFSARFARPAPPKFNLAPSNRFAVRKPAPSKFQAISGPVYIYMSEKFSFQALSMTLIHFLEFPLIEKISDNRNNKLRFGGSFQHNFQRRNAIKSLFPSL